MILSDKLHRIGVNVFYIFFLVGMNGVISGGATVRAQIRQVVRYEKEHQSKDLDKTVISMGKYGLALIQDQQKYEQGKYIWEVTLMDTTLHVFWSEKLAIKNQYKLIGYDYRDNVLYFLFNIGEHEQRKITIIKLPLNSLQFQEYEFDSALSLQLLRFHILGQKAILAGYVLDKPTVLLYDLLTAQVKLVPGLPLQKTKLLDVRMNTNGTFNILMVDKTLTASSKLVLKIMDDSGRQLLDNVVELPAKCTILSGITSTLIKDELIVVGTWTEGVGEQSAGIYSILVTPSSNQKINFYDFVQFNYFLDYLSPKQKLRIKEKANRKRQTGKVPSFRAYVLPIRLEETKHGFVFFSETYQTVNTYVQRTNSLGNYPYYFPYGYPSFRNNNFWPGYSNFSAHDYPQQSINETKFLQANLVVFNTQGEWVADQGCKLDELETSTVEQQSEFVYTKNKNAFVFLKKNKIHVHVTQLDGTPLVSQQVEYLLQNPVDELIVSHRDNNDGKVSYWYDDTLFVYGYQTIKNGNQENRHVFFINKAIINTENRDE